MIPVAITGIGLVSGLGEDPAAVLAAVRRGETAVKKTGDLRDQLPCAGQVTIEVDCVPLLKRKKDKKLLPRAAELAMVACWRALGADRPHPGDGLRPWDIGMFMGVGREPADDPRETDLALRLSHTDRRLDVAKLATAGLAAYPPLTPLRTLPNLALAHVAIHLGFEGECGTRTGEEAAGMAAIVEGWWSVAEGRSEVVLAGGADVRVDPGSMRDLVRLGRLTPDRGAGEGAGFLRLESLDRARARGAHIYGVITAGGIAPGRATPADPAFDRALGAAGAAAAPMELVLRVQEGPGSLSAIEATGATAWIAWE